MAAYAALLSLAQTLNMDQNHCKHLSSIQAKDRIKSIHEYVLFLLDKAKIRDVAYQTEDIIELFMWQKMQLNYAVMSPSREELENLLINLMDKIGDIAGATMEDRPAAFSSSSSSSSSTLARAATPSSSPRVARAPSYSVIGLDDDLMAIKDRLCGPSSKLQTPGHTHIGYGRHGKTALAATIYNDPLITRHFDIRAWLTVSQDYTEEKLREILVGLVDPMKLLKVEMPVDDSEIALKLYKKLKGRRYLIVMDDVWGTQVWANVRNMVPD